MKIFSGILFVLITFKSFTQTIQTTQLNVENIGQFSSTSCWAASIGTAIKYYSGNLNIQCELLKIPNCNNEISTESGPTKNIRQILSCLDTNFQKYRVTLPKSYSVIPVPTGTNFKDSVSFKDIKTIINNGSLLLNYKRFAGNSSHITIWDGYEHTIAQNKQMKWIFVKDPWPKKRTGFKGGSEYLITNEFYRRPFGEITDKDNPQNALIYNFELPKKRITRNIFKRNTGEISENNSSVNIVTSLKKGPIKTTLFTQANSVLDHIKLTANKETLKKIGLSAEKVKNISIILNNYLKVYEIKSQTKENVEIKTPQGDYLKTTEIIYHQLITLFDSLATYLVPLKISENGKFVNKSVMAFEKTIKKDWYTTRIGKYEGSLFQVVENVVGNIKKVKAVYVNLNYSDQNDYMIIEPIDINKKPILIDLFSKMDYFEKPDSKTSKGAFNYSVHELKKDKFEKFADYISPISTIDENAFKITESGKKILEACNNLLNGNNVPMKMRASEYNDGDVKSGIDTLLNNLPFKASFFKDLNYPNGIFNLQWDGNIEILYNPKIDNGIIKSRSNVSFQVFFVPISDYKMISQKKGDLGYNTEGANYVNLMNFAIPTDNIKAIGSPHPETKKGYMATYLNEEKYYNSVISSKGIVCEITLKNNKKVVCYVLNNYDAPKDINNTNYPKYGTVKWKK